MTRILIDLSVDNKNVILFLSLSEHMIRIFVLIIIEQVKKKLKRITV